MTQTVTYSTFPVDFSQIKVKLPQTYYIPVQLPTNVCEQLYYISIRLARPVREIIDVKRWIFTSLSSSFAPLSHSKSPNKSSDIRMYVSGVCGRSGPAKLSNGTHPPMKNKRSPRNWPKYPRNVGRFW